MRIFFIFLIFLFFLTSCTSDVIGVVLKNDTYSSRVIEIMNDHQESSFNLFKKYLDEDVFIEYSGKIYNGKQNLIEVWKSEFYYFSDVFLTKKKYLQLLIKTDPTPLFSKQIGMLVEISPTIVIRYILFMNLNGNTIEYLKFMFIGTMNHITKNGIN